MTLQALRVLGHACAVLTVGAAVLTAFILVVGDHRPWAALTVAALAGVLALLLFRTRLADVPETALVFVTVPASVVTARWSLCALVLCTLAVLLAAGRSPTRPPGRPTGPDLLAGALVLTTAGLGVTELVTRDVPAGQGRYLALAAVAAAGVVASRHPRFAGTFPDLADRAAAVAVAALLVTGACYVCTPVTGHHTVRDAVNTWGTRLLLLVLVVVCLRLLVTTTRYRLASGTDVSPVRGVVAGVGGALPAVGMTAVGVLGVLALSAMSLQWANPTTTRFSALDRDGTLQEWVGSDDISRYLLAEVVLHEDNGRFGYPGLGARDTPVNYRLFADRIRVQLHNSGILPGTGCTGTDAPEVVEAHMDDVSSKEQYADALDGLLDSDRCIRDPSGSEIPMQLAKNLYGNRDGAWYNKAVEFLLVHPLTFTADDRRILELYLNWSQFGPGIYGVCTASWYYFGSAPGDLDVDRATYLADMLPISSEVRRDADRGGPLLDRDRLAAQFRAGEGADAPAPDSATDPAADRATARADAVVGVLTARHTELAGAAAGDGWRAVLAPLGIGDAPDRTAGSGAAGSAGAADDGAVSRGGACATMPGSVADRLRDEGTDPAAWTNLNQVGQDDRDGGEQ